MKISELEEGKLYRTFWGTVEELVRIEESVVYCEEIDAHVRVCNAVFHEPGFAGVSHMDEDEVARFVIEEVAA